MNREEFEQKVRELYETWKVRASVQDQWRDIETEDGDYDQYITAVTNRKALNDAAGVLNHKIDELETAIFAALPDSSAWVKVDGWAVGNKVCRGGWKLVIRPWDERNTYSESHDRIRWE